MHLPVKEIELRVDGAVRQVVPGARVEVDSYPLDNARGALAIVVPAFSRPLLAGVAVDASPPGGGRRSGARRPGS